jgi:DNA polymerase-3 subunit epsilon
MRALSRSHQLVSSGNWLVLDTETTGLGAFDQVIEVSLCDPELHIATWRIQPTVPIQEEATFLHGMTEADLAHAPTYAEIWPVIEQHIARRVTVMWNAEFDYHRLARSARAHQMKRPGIDHRWCVMTWFAQFYRQKSDQGDYCCLT